MNGELQLGKYEFYPYADEDFTIAPSLEELLEQYEEMSKDEKAETEALEWAEGLIGDVADGEWSE